MEYEEIEAALAASEFFKNLEKKNLEKVAEICKPQSCRAEEYIFMQGDFGEDLYIIIGGQVFLERSVDLGDRKGSVTIEILGRGRLLGCWSTLLGDPHTLMSSARCQAPTRLLAFKGATLRQMMMENKTFGFSVMERFCFLLRDRVQAAYGAMERI
jgi:CRP/FNR family transcriptional regulator, cyclic AMP receptor protein